MSYLNSPAHNYCQDPDRVPSPLQFFIHQVPPFFHQPKDAGQNRQLCIPILFFLFLFFWLCCVACGILIPHPGIGPVPPTAEAWSLNHWTTREVPIYSHLNQTCDSHRRHQLWHQYSSLCQTRSDHVCQPAPFSGPFRSCTKAAGNLGPYSTNLQVSEPKWSWITDWLVIIY